jgi:hypothetical protein
MPSGILEGASLVDATGRAILMTTFGTLVAGALAHLWTRARYSVLQRDLERNGGPPPRFTHPLLVRIAGDAQEAARSGGERNTQALVEDHFRAGLGSLLLAERFLRSATGLVLVLGLLGTFYGLTLSIGKLVHLVSADTGLSGDVAMAMTQGLTDALTGMAVAFSNSLVGIGSAVILTVLGVVNNVTDRRTALMIQIETYLDRHLPVSAPARGGGAAISPDAFAQSMARLESAVARFESALLGFAKNTKDLREVQLVVAVKPRDEG